MTNGEISGKKSGMLPFVLESDRAGLGFVKSSSHSGYSLNVDQFRQFN